MIFIDTSVWVQYFRGKDVNVINRLNHLLDELQIGVPIPVYVEILSGASKNEISQLSRVFSALPKFYPNQTTWDRIITWIEKGRQNGFRFGAADLLIGSICADHSAILWTLDKDFFEMKKLKFLELI